MPTPDQSTRDQSTRDQVSIQGQPDLSGLRQSLSFSLASDAKLVLNSAAAEKACRSLIQAFIADPQDTDRPTLDAALAEALFTFGLPADYIDRHYAHTHGVPYEMSDAEADQATARILSGQRPGHDAEVPSAATPGSAHADAGKIAYGDQGDADETSGALTTDQSANHVLDRAIAGHIDSMKDLGVAVLLTMPIAELARAHQADAMTIIENLSKIRELLPHSSALDSVHEVTFNVLREHDDILGTDPNPDDETVDNTSFGL